MPGTSPGHDGLRAFQFTRTTSRRIRRSDDALVLEAADIALAEPEPAAEHFGCVLAEERRRRDLWRLAVKADREGRHPQLAIRVMLRLDDAAALEGRLGEEIAGVHD